MNFFSKFTDKIAQYAEARLDLIKLNFVQRVSRILSFLIFTIICLLFTLCIFIFVGIGLGEFFTVLMDSKVVGYFLSAACFFLLFIILIIARNVVADIFTDIFIRILTDQDDDNDEGQKP